MTILPYGDGNEPKQHPLIENSFIFLSGIIWRAAPEVLLLELMREVFNGNCKGEKGTIKKDLVPSIEELTDEERALLYIMQGRRKEKGKKEKVKFYAPAYPQVAEKAWLRQKEARVVYYNFLKGPIPQYIWYNSNVGSDPQVVREKLIDNICKALQGNNSYYNPGAERIDILAATLKKSSFLDNNKAAKDTEAAKNHLINATGKHGSLMDLQNDELSSRISKDFEAICDLEPQIPRMQWLQLLMTFLRLAIPIWVLSKMQITLLLHSWLMDVVDNDGEIPRQSDIVVCLGNRNRRLLNPTLIPSTELHEYIDRYMKCRVELSIFMKCLDDVTNGQLNGKILSVNGAEDGQITIYNFLSMVKSASNDIKKDIECSNVRTFLIDTGYHYIAWRDPMIQNGGVGKNIKELLDVLTQIERSGDSGGDLFLSPGRGKTGHIIFPGQLLIKTMTVLASRLKGEGTLMLSDVESHFAQYGIDFSTSADARPELIRKLRNMGLLMGSPDAGNSVVVVSPYRLQRGSI